MTVKEYREKNPNCCYCTNRTNGMDYCSATDKRMSKRTAKKCPCYVPEKWYLDKEDATSSDTIFKSIPLKK